MPDPDHKKGKFLWGILDKPASSPPVSEIVSVFRLELNYI